MKQFNNVLVICLILIFSNISTTQASKVDKSQSLIAGRLDIPDMIAEGISRDNRTGDFYLGSLKRGEIWKINSSGIANKFNQQPTIFKSIFGLKVDAKNDLLWVLANPGGDYDKNWGSSVIMAFELETGKIIHQKTLKGISGEHLLNDLVVADNGTIYITDTHQGSIFGFTKEQGFTTILESGKLHYPNGLVMLPNQKHLLIAAVGGLYRFTIKTGELLNLQSEHGRLVGGFDGLSLSAPSSTKHRLIAVQNAGKESRIIIMTFNDDFSIVETAKVLDEKHPLIEVATTGTLHNNQYYYIANSQMDYLDTKTGELKPDSKMNPTYILQVQIN